MWCSFHAHYLCLPDDPIFQSGLSGGFCELLGQPDKSYITPAIDGKILGTSSPIWSSPWRGGDVAALLALRIKSAKGMFWGTVHGVTIALLFWMGLAAQQILPNGGGVRHRRCRDTCLGHQDPAPGPTGLALSGHPLRDESTADSYLLVSVQTVVSDLARLHPAAKEKQEILFSRIVRWCWPWGHWSSPCTSRVPTTCSRSPGPSYAAAGRTACPGGSVLKKATSAGIMAGMLGPCITVVWKLGKSPWSGCHRPSAPSPAASCWWESAWHIPEAPHRDGAAK